MMKSLLLFALIFVAVGSHADKQACQTARKNNPQDCKDEIATQRAGQAAQSSILANACKPDSKGNTDMQGCADRAANQAAATKSANQIAKNTCNAKRRDCVDKCNPAQGKDAKEKQEIKTLKDECTRAIDGDLAKLLQEEKQADVAKQGGEKTSEEARGGQGDNKNSSAPAAMPPMSPQQKKDDEEKTDATQPQSTPQQAQTPAQEQKKDEAKDGKSGFDGESKTQSADNSCSGGKFMCPGCPGFLQKCPNGNATECISKMSASDQKIIGSNCGNTTGSSTTTQALTNPTTPQSLMGGGAGGSGGGTSGTVSGGMDTQSMLDDGKKNDTQSHEGRKEGGSLGTESGGGGGGGSSDSFGSSGGDLFGDSGNAASAFNMGKAVPRSLASAFQSSQDSRVVDRFGPNLFSILGETIKGRCDRNLLLHCPNRK